MKVGHSFFGWQENDSFQMRVDRPVYFISVCNKRIYGNYIVLHIVENYIDDILALDILIYIHAIICFLFWVPLSLCGIASYLYVHTHLTYIPVNLVGGFLGSTVEDINSCLPRLKKPRRLLMPQGVDLTRADYSGKTLEWKTWSGHRTWRLLKLWNCTPQLQVWNSVLSSTTTITTYPDSMSQWNWRYSSQTENPLSMGTYLRIFLVQKFRYLRPNEFHWGKSLGSPSNNPSCGRANGSLGVPEIAGVWLVLRDLETAFERCFFWNVCQLSFHFIFCHGSKLSVVKIQCL